MRNSISDHSNTSASLATYGKQLNLPHVLFDNSQSPCNNDNISTPILKPQYNSFVPKDFETCNKVLIRKPGILKSLEQPYAGPYDIVNRNFKNHTIELNIDGCVKCYSMSNLKPYIERKVSFA